MRTSTVDAVAASEVPGDDVSPTISFPPPDEHATTVVAMIVDTRANDA
jgi:hypothetical protein